MIEPPIMIHTGSKRLCSLQVIESLSLGVNLGIRESQRAGPVNCMVGCANLVVQQVVRLSLRKPMSGDVTARWVL